MWRISEEDEGPAGHQFDPVNLRYSHQEDLVFAEDDVVIVLLVYRGTNGGILCMTGRRQPFFGAPKAHRGGAFFIEDIQERVTI